MVTQITPEVTTAATDKQTVQEILGNNDGLIITLQPNAGLIDYRSHAQTLNNQGSLFIELWALGVSVGVNTNTVLAGAVSEGRAV